MPNTPAIRVQDVSVMFRMHKEKIDNLKEYVIRVLRRKVNYTEFWALRDISFTVEKGERLGVLGFNGAGKSTLLKVIAGVMKPTGGTVEIEGVIAPLLELGAGFDNNYSGRENIFLYGATMGYSRAYIKERYDEILAFSELKEFIDAPVKNYSSGMFDSGVTVLFVSHNTDQVRSICNKAILLEKGRIVAQGAADEVCDIYDAMVRK